MTDPTPTPNDAHAAERLRRRMSALCDELRTVPPMQADALVERIRSTAAELRALRRAA
jgi:hypothetical protein